MLALLLSAALLAAPSPPPCPCSACHTPVSAEKHPAKASPPKRKAKPKTKPKTAPHPGFGGMF